MNDDEEAPDRRLNPVVYWLIVLAIAVCLGVAAPALFLLGFWEMAPLVLLATWLAPKLTRGHL
jgi:fatty acid desaturase